MQSSKQSKKKGNQTARPLGLASGFGGFFYLFRKPTNFNVFASSSVHFSFFAQYQTHDFDQVDKEQGKHIKTALLVTGILCFTKHCTSRYESMCHNFIFLPQLLRIKSELNK